MRRRGRQWRRRGKWREEREAIEEKRRGAKRSGDEERREWLK